MAQVYNVMCRWDNGPHYKLYICGTSWLLVFFWEKSGQGDVVAEGDDFSMDWENPDDSYSVEYAPGQFAIL